MPYTDLLRFTVFVTGAEATILGAISAISVGGEPSATTTIVALAWWLISLILGFWLGRPHWGQGLMTEAGRALLDMAFQVTDLHMVTATARPGNGRSIGVLEACGFEAAGHGWKRIG